MAGAESQEVEFASVSGSPYSSDPTLIEQLRSELEIIRRDALDLEQRFAERLTATHPAFGSSARNLVHYVALRRRDIRPLQERLTALGLSSLGRTESHVLAGIEAVLKVLGHMTGRPLEQAAAGIDFNQGKRLLRQHTEAVLGTRPPARGVRIMVTMPSEAAHDYPLVRELLANGMNCMRINCAHDDPDAWGGMVENLRRAKEETGRDCRVLMDLAGPKLRTGQVDPTSQCLKWGPQRDLRGRTLQPARIWLSTHEAPAAPPGAADGCVRVPAEWLAALKPGDVVRFSDLRKKKRDLIVERRLGASAWACGEQTAYLQQGMGLEIERVCSSDTYPLRTDQAWVEAASPADNALVLRPGDTLLLTRAPIPGHPAVCDARGRVQQPAAIACTLPQVFGDVRPQERIWFDDGKIGGVVESVSPEVLRVRITVARPEGEKLRADKGINLPDTALSIPALTEKDLRDLGFVVRHADLVGLSFVRRPRDVRDLQAELDALGAQQIGIILKIETVAAFQQLPSLLLTAMRGRRVGVMIARGDLAVECGYERLAEVQEEILWFCEAAHVPVIWATQVLENLAKKGVPSRAEITDAAMGERAECVMLNKGPHLVAAVRVLDDILQRMEAHQSKKSARLRRLRLSAIAAE